MLIEKNSTCNQITLTPEDLLITSSSGERVCSTLYLTKDCCSDPIELKLPLHLTFTTDTEWKYISDQGSHIYSSFNWWIVDTKDIIESITLNGTPVLKSNYTDNQNNLLTDIYLISTDATLLLPNVSVPISDFDITPVEELEIDLEITLKNCNRKVNLKLFIDATNLEVWESEQVVTVTDLDVSEGVSFTDNPYVITLDPRVIGLLETDVFPDSVYNFLIEDSYKNGEDITLRTEERSRFLECHTHCQVVDYIRQYPTDTLYMVYEALHYAYNCTFMSFKELCELWNYIGLKLGFFTGDPCAEAIASDCNCN